MVAAIIPQQLNDKFPLEIGQELLTLANDLSIPNLAISYDRAMVKMVELLKVLGLYHKTQYQIEATYDDLNTIQNIERFLVRHHHTLESPEETAQKLLNYLHYFEGVNQG